MILKEFRCLRGMDLQNVNIRIGLVQTYIKDLYKSRIKFYEKSMEFIQESNRNQKLIKSLQSSGQIYLGTYSQVTNILSSTFCCRYTIGTGI